MTTSPTTVDAWLSAYEALNEDIFNFSMIKPLPSEWAEKTIVLPKQTSVYSGPYTYRWTPYMRQIIDHLHPGDPVRFVTVMKCVQSGATQGLVVPGICYIIDQIPDNILFTASDKELLKKTITERLDPILRESRLDHLIRPNVVKKTNNRTGDTAYQKEYRGGVLTGIPTSNPNAIRFYSTRYNLNDDYDTTPLEAGKEGSPEELMEGRQVSFGGKAKTFRISTPTVTQTSHIWKSYQRGTQNKWNWPCPSCKDPVPVDFKMTMADGSLAGLVWNLDDRKRLLPKTIYFRCVHCGCLISEKDKYDINLMGQWLSTVDIPVEERHESYLIPGLALPPGFIGWEYIIQKFLKANPQGERANIMDLKTFNNLYLGLPFEEIGTAPRVNELMENTRTYQPGIVPDKTCEADGNGRIVMLTLSCDINGLMEPDNEDVRLDWEILAHTSRGPSYSVDHGSIGTFKRKRDALKGQQPDDEFRMKWTLVHNSRAVNEHGEVVNNSVWPVLQELIQKIYPLESKETSDVKPTTSDPVDGRNLNISLIDTGFGERYVMPFIKDMQQLGLFVYGIKGREEDNYRKLQKDANPVVRSKESPRELYIIEVNQVKDDLAEMMKLRLGEDGSQPHGFMNFPQPNQGKYTMDSFFKHYESERRTEVMSPKSGEPIGYKWVKKHSGVQNHFWDVRVYGLCGPLIYLDLLRQSDTKYKLFTWDDVVAMLL